MVQKKQINIVVCDADPIHGYAFNHAVSNNDRVRLTVVQPGSDEARDTQNTPDLIMVNMGTGTCCVQLLLQNMLRRNPGIPLVCYISETRVCSQILQQHRERITVVSFGEIIRCLQEYAGMCSGKVPRAGHPIDAGADDPDPAASCIGLLSPKELDVFCLFGRGNGTSEVAAILHCSTSTVETHLRHIRIKLHLNSSDKLRRLAFRQVLFGDCHTFSRRLDHVCPERGGTVGTCPFRDSV